MSKDNKKEKKIKNGEAVIMGVKRDNVPFAGVNEGTESPNKVAKRRSHALRPFRTYYASSRTSFKSIIHNYGVPDGKYLNYRGCINIFSGTAQTSPQIQTSYKNERNFLQKTVKIV